DESAGERPHAADDDDGKQHCAHLQRHRRLEQILETQLARGKGALPLPWSETILQPDTARFVWRAHSLSAPKGGGVFRVAIDPPTRWYYIGQAGTAGAPLTLYGPIEEAAKGRFIDALASARAVSSAAPPAAKPATSPQASQSKKPDSKSKPKPKPKSSTKVKN
ncbi:MAG: hypothetical protein ABI633_11465, partial [Burkholderiales bacterium]